MTALFFIISVQSYADERVQLNRDGYVEACTDLVYTTDPMIVLAQAFGKKIGPQVKEDIRDMCKCFADQHQIRLARIDFTVDGANFLVGEQFGFFQTRQMNYVHSSVRAYVYEDTKECAPEFFMHQK